MKYGPISAAISAMMKAIESPSSVVCTVSPLEHAPAQLACAAWRIGALALQNIAVTIRQRPRRRAENLFRSKDIYRANTSLGAGYPYEAARDTGRPQFRIDRVVEPQVRQAPQQGGDRELGLDAR